MKDKIFRVKNRGKQLKHTHNLVDLAAKGSEGWTVKFYLRSLVNVTPYLNIS